MVAVNIRDFPNDLHRFLKIKAAEDGTTIKALIIKYAQDGLQRDKKSTKTKKGGKVHGN